MEVAIIGLGNFGGSLVRRLYELGHEITALDLDEAAVNKVKDMCRQAVVGDATDRSVLEELGVGLMEAAVVSMGEHLGASILATLHLKELGVKRIVSKAVSPEHEKILKRLGASQVVFPEREAAHRLAVSLTAPNLLEYLPLGKEFSVAELAPPAAMVGKSLAELDLRRRFGVSVIAVRELVPERTRLVIEPDYVVKDSDILVVVGRQKDLERLREL